jgi:hypothetical protein
MRGKYNVLSKIVTRDVSQSEKKNQYLKSYNNVRNFVLFLLIYFSIYSVGKKWKQLQNIIKLHVFNRSGALWGISETLIRIPFPFSDRPHSFSKRHQPS